MPVSALLEATHPNDIYHPADDDDAGLVHRKHPTRGWQCWFPSQGYWEDTSNTSYMNYEVSYDDTWCEPENLHELEF